jgi:hypothetical protein
MVDIVSLLTQVLSLVNILFPEVASERTGLL